MFYFILWTLVMNIIWTLGMLNKNFPSGQRIGIYIYLTLESLLLNSVLQSLYSVSNWNFWISNDRSACYYKNFHSENAKYIRFLCTPFFLFLYGIFSLYLLAEYSCIWTLGREKCEVSNILPSSWPYILLAIYLLGQLSESWARC